MENFIPGQRWISNTESELGLGLILEVTPQRVTVLFLASDQKRTYARDNAPLTRVSFGIGDVIESADEELLTIVKLNEKDGLITYIGKTKSGREVSLDEIELSHYLKFNKPQDRLFNGQTDPSAWFLLRYQTWRYRQKLQQSPTTGLLGGRTSLIPHQLYIAHEVANRMTPRVMLADEVGLGKTIEAGLIVHYRLINGLSSRVLIIVPDALLYQWLVEMLRRFNLRFSIIDAESCQRLSDFDEDEEDTSESKAENNPFQNEQLVLCSQEFFQRYPERQLQALEADYDIVIVDEAHHLEWNEISPSSGYLFVEQLSRKVPAVLLLTATPEQLGQESHFARLRLLDPDRFHSFSAFMEEQKNYEPVAEAAQLLLAGQTPSYDLKQKLTELLKDDKAETLLNALDEPTKAPEARAELIMLLLDHHGTGRILFRNSRRTVTGFPDRQHHGYLLPTTNDANASLEFDPRFIWLVAKIKALAGKKALLICKHAQTAVELEHTLKNRAGIACALFHENLSIIERDRAAAYFADGESSARLLICSEIGSEGRNFQFVHHLILFDLPDNPDLLQQRIGRLDRIGQKHVIQIHVPFLENSRDHSLYRWYDEGLDVFRKNNPAAQKVAECLRDELADILAQHTPDGLEALIAKTRILNAEIGQQLHNGRDLLLELNSCRQKETAQLMQELTVSDNDSTLWPYLENLLDCYGIDTDYCSEDCYIVKPGDHMRVSYFPGLPEDGMTFTVNRQLALAREELQFLTWEHPFMMSAMEEVVIGHTGNAAISVVRHDSLKSGRFLLECLFIVECSAPAVLQVGRFLPPTPVFILVDQNKNDLTETFSHESLQDAGVGFDKNRITAFLNAQRPLLNSLFAFAEQQAKAQMQIKVDEAAKTMLTSLTAEIKRLVRLKKINPSVKDEEIEQLKNAALLTHEHILSAQLKLDAVRFIISQ